MVDKKQDKILPDSTTEEELASSFLTFFTQKIEKVRANFSNQSICKFHMSVDTGNKFAAFKNVSEDDIKQIVVSYGSKSSPEGPIPPVMSKENLDMFVPIWTKLVNLSLAEGSMEALKYAILIPLIKDLEDHMDKDELKNYRKLIERIISMQLNQHMSKNNLHSKFQ